MENFTYAHNDTSNGERNTVTAQFNKPRLSPKIKAVRGEAFKAEIPVSNDETLNFLITLVCALKPLNVLELGTAVGASGAVMLENCPSAHLTTIERNENFYNAARENFAALGLCNRVTLICGDAGEEIEKLDGGFDFIFLDCAKAQYIKYLSRLKSLLKKGGVLVADDVLLYGYVTGEAETPKKRKMLVQHIKEYINAVTTDEALATTVLNVGNGVALSVKL